MHFSNNISPRRIITYGLFSLCAYAAWARGGIYGPLQWPLLVISFLLCFSPLLIDRDRRVAFWARVRLDPLFWIGLGLMLIIMVQWGNSNYWVVLTQSGGAEMARTPSKWIPWSVDRREAGEMLVWFFPVWIGILLIRNLLHRKHLMSLLYLFAINSALLSCVGLALVAGGTDRVLGIWEQKFNSFFASFSYVNHAAEWFYLNAFLAAGLAHHALSKRRPMIQMMVWAVFFLLCVLAVFMTLSRLGAVIALALLGVFSGMLIKRALARVRGVAVLNVYIFGAIIVLVGGVLFFGAGGGDLAKEIGQKAIIGEVSVVHDLGGRIDQMPLAWDIIKDYPLFGAGGWSYRWLTKIYLPVAEWDLLSGMGKANVHCDPLQFLSEFGVVGFLLISSGFWILLGGAFRFGKTGKLSLWVLSGAIIVSLHSLIDLPFRCPAILMEWAFLLAALPKLSGRSQDIHTGSRFPVEDASILKATRADS